VVAVVFIRGVSGAYYSSRVLFGAKAQDIQLCVLHRPHVPLLHVCSREPPAVLDRLPNPFPSTAAAPL